MSRFEGFGLEVRDWFEGLEADNSREYFAARRDFYEESVRDQMDALLTELSDEFGGQVKLFRQNRDIRFSRDKSPYKTNTYGIVYGSKIAKLGLYASISARGLVAGSGYHVMARDQLERYRERAADPKHGPELMTRPAPALTTQISARARRLRARIREGRSGRPAAPGSPRDRHARPACR